MLENVKLENVLFLDIETAPIVPSFNDLPENFKELWDKKSVYFRKNEESAEDVFNKAGIYSEFGKIVCISIGIINTKNNAKTFRVKSFCSENESELLKDFIELLNTKFNREEIVFCAHNGKEFDYPFIARRILINKLKIPKILDLAGKKPWEVKHLDTLELWKFGDYKHYTSLNLLAAIFNIPTPKDDIDGSMVAEVFWKERNLDRIITYCEKDVLTVAQLFLSYKGEPLIDPDLFERV